MSAAAEQYDAKDMVTDMIVLDLEWNRGYDKKPLDEVLQIGAVKLEGLGSRIVDTFNAYIRPQVHQKLNPPARHLPELERILSSEQTFLEAEAAFLLWCGEDRSFAVWGGDDVDILRQNCGYWGLPPLQAEEVYDFQAAFSRKVGTGQSLALYRAVEYCGIPDVFTYHNALNDAMYTALVAPWLREEDLHLQKLPRSLRQLAEVSFPAQPVRTVGSFSGRETALNSREVRRQACPLCGAVCWVVRWYHREELYWYGGFHCAQHGWFFCRAAVSQRANGSWRVRTAVPPATLSFLREVHAAALTQVHLCKRTGRRKKRRRARGMPPGE